MRGVLYVGRHVLMTMLILSLALLAQAYHTIHGGLVVTPPKLEVQPPAEVWYHIPSTGAPTKFSLKCEADGDPEKFEWEKNGETLFVDGDRIIWEKKGRTGSISFQEPTPDDQGYYQCFVTNIFGTAVSNRVHVQLGVLDHFVRKAIKEVTVTEGDSLTLHCETPYGVPEPSVFWLFRSEVQSSIIESINREHITVDGDGNLQFSYVKAHDGRENLLYQCAATSPVLHGEYRAGDEFRLIVQKQRTLQPRPPEKLWFSPEEINVTAGQQLKLTCIFGGLPVPKVTWYKENGDLPMDRLVEFGKIDYGKTLMIKNVEPSDSGTFVCQSLGKKHYMTVHVTAAPFWINDGWPKDVSVAEESSAELRCEAGGDPPPMVKWYMNGKTLDSVEPNPRRVVSENGVALQIHDLNHDLDTGVYQCNASSVRGYVFANAYINVRAHAPKIKGPANTTHLVVLGSRVDMDCEVRAAPSARLKWVDSKDRRITDRPGKLKILTNNTLRLYDASFADSDLYYCNVTNKYGINRATRKLEVYKPTFMTKNLDPELVTMENPGKAVEMQCEAESDERLQVQYRWSHNGRPIRFKDDHYSLLGPNHLRIEDARGRHSGRYDCVAKTLVDKKSSSMNLIVKDIPEPPEITSIECNQRTASIRWKAAYSNFDPLTSYLVEYRTDFKRKVWKTAITMESDSVLKNETLEAQMILTPWVNYTFRVIAINTHGQGVPGYLDSKCNTKPSFPYNNPEHVRAEGNARDNLVIYWQPMEKEQWNGDRFRYVVRYRLSEDRSQDWEKVVIEDPLQSNVTIRDTPTFRKYLVRVRALNTIGESIVDPSTVVGWSGEDVPRKAPEDFDVGEVINATSVTFSWSHIALADVRGHFRGYKVQTWLVEESRKRKRAVEFVHDVMVQPDVSSVTVHDLTPMKAYGAHVIVVNGKYEGRPSTPKFFTMPEGYPEKVTHLRVRPVGSRTFTVHWERPLRTYGNLRGYFIYIRDIANDTLYETYVISPVKHLIYGDAQADRHYEVSVAGQTGAGEGPRVSEKVKTWPEQSPGQPDLEVEFLTPSSVRVRWIPSKDGLPGSGFYLNYSLVDKEDWRHTKLIRLPRRDAEIDKLDPNENYRIVLVAQDEHFRTRSKMKRFQTTGGEVSEKGTESLAGAVWFIAIICAVAVALVSVIVVCICQTSRGGKYPVKKKEMERGHTMDHDEERSFMEYQYGGAYGKEDT